MGRYIAVDGPNGLGKSTLINNTTDTLRGLGHSVALYREPGGRVEGDIPLPEELAKPAELAELLREILKGNLYETDDVTDALLFSVGRAAIAPLIAHDVSTHDFVIADRSWISTMAFQTYRGDLDKNMTRQISAFATQHMPETEYLILDGDYSVVKKFNPTLEGDPDKWETGEADHEIDRIAFKTEAHMIGMSVLGVIQADQSQEEVVTQFLKYLGIGGLKNE